MQDSGLLFAQGGNNADGGAAKSYLAQWGTPEKPGDIAKFFWLKYAVRPDSEFEIMAPEVSTLHLSPAGRFVTNDSRR